MKRTYNIVFRWLSDKDTDSKIISTHTNMKEALKAQKEYLKDKEDCLSYIQTVIEKEAVTGQFGSQVATGQPPSTSLDGCPFHYCDKNPVCENKCRYDN